MTQSTDVPVERVAWPGNGPGLRKKTVPTMAKFIRRRAHDPRFRALAGQILRDAGFPKTIQAKCEALRLHVKSVTDYANDPFLAEYVQDPEYSLCLPDAAMCAPLIDCDDGVPTVDALIGAAGMQPFILLLEYGGGAQIHVMGGVKDEKGSVLEVDVTTDKPVGSKSWSKTRTVVDPFDSKMLETGEFAGGEFVGAGKAFDGTVRPVDPALHLVGAGDATPGDVLAYRAMWNPYVLDIACGLSIQSWALTQAAAGTTPTTIDSQHLAALGLCPNSGSWVPDNTPVLDTSGLAQQPPSAQLLTALAQVASDASDALVTQWNNFSGLSDVQITQQAASVLQAYQDTVLQAGQQYQPMLADHSPALAAALPTGPDKSLQNQLIARIEGAGILARGTLKVIGIGVSGAVTSVGQAVADVGKATFSPWLWVSVAVIAASAATVAVVYVFKTTGAPFKMLRASEMVQTKRRKKRRKMAA